MNDFDDSVMVLGDGAVNAGEAGMVSGSQTFQRDPRLSRLADNNRHHASRPEWRRPKDAHGRDMELCPVCGIWQRREAFSPERYRSGQLLLHKVCKTCRAEQKRTGRPPGRPPKLVASNS